VQERPCGQAPGKRGIGRFRAWLTRWDCSALRSVQRRKVAEKLTAQQTKQQLPVSMSACYQSDCNASCHWPSQGQAHGRGTGWTDQISNHALNNRMGPKAAPTAAALVCPRLVRGRNFFFYV
jgi:hypothetical protein